jgi:hypothetical protein
MTLEEYFVSSPRLTEPPPDSKFFWEQDELAEADLLEVRQRIWSWSNIWLSRA